MTIGTIFMIAAAVVFFLGGVGSSIIPNAVTWGLFCLAMGLLLDDYDFGFRRRR